MNKTYDIYYDEESDFLEVFFGEAPENEYSEEIEPGIFITKNEDDSSLRGIGIFSFKKRCNVLKDLFKRFDINFPLNIGCD